ncbi:MAG: DUF2490 domain-containing protein [Candidatus Erginobacter occultus]|nr:DUF2490 domain-containing protein [Candidatus Erginobacter occultus]
MRKQLLIASALAAFLVCQPAAEAKDDWEWWLYTPVSYKMAGDVKLDAQGMFRWKNDMKDYFYRGVIVGGSYSLCPWVSVGGHFWYKEVRKDKSSPWVYTDTYVGNLNFQYQAADWLVFKENNRIEYNNENYKWTLRVKPRVDFPLAWLGLKPLTLYVDNEFFFKFDLDDERDTFSENRFTVAADVKIAGPLGATVAYRSVAKQASSTGDWSNTNVLVTSAKLSF